MNTQKAIQAIDAVTTAIINGTINTTFIDQLIYEKLDDESYKHIRNKWGDKEGDVFGFYLNASDDTKRWLLEALGVEVEPDKYPDYFSRVIAKLRNGKKRTEIYPFETETVHSFFLFGYNNSLESLETISPSAWNTVLENSIDRYGNYKNWSLLWTSTSQQGKEMILKHLFENELS